MARLGRTVHAALAAVAVVVAGVVLGSGISGYALAPSNDGCLSEIWNERTSEGAYSLVPFGTRCEVQRDDGTERVVVLGPSVPAWIAWMVAMTAFVAWAARRPGTRAVAGALAAAAMITVCGIASHRDTDFLFTMWMAVYLGTPLALVTRHLWLPLADRSWARSLGVTFLLAPTVFLVASIPTFFGGAWGHAGGVLGLLTGAALSAIPRRVPWLGPPEHEPA